MKIDFVRRRAARAAGRVGGDLVDVRGPGQVENGVRAGQRVVQGIGVEQVGRAVIGCRVTPPVADVNGAYLVAGPQQVIHHVRADEAAPAGDR